MRKDKIRELTLDSLFNLVEDAKLVDWKYGHNEDSTPRDWTEWVNLRRSITSALHALKREGR